MDTTETTHISLCTGYGGIDLGLKRVCPGLRTIAYAEIEAFAIECLLARMEGGQLDAAPIWSDLKSFPWAEFSGKVDILTGGYPCQPFSSAGKRLGSDDPRHLWPHIASGIRLLQPRICFFENVEGHITLGLSSVISDLEDLGYRTTWGIFSAAECGAPHQRKRVFILAHRSGEGLQGRVWLRQTGTQGASSGHAAKCGGTVALASSIGGAAGISGSFTRHERQSGVADYSSDQAWPSRPGQPQHAWEPPRVVGNAALLDGTGQARGQRETQVGRADTARDNGQTQPAMGGDAYGPLCGLDYAELSVSCDNRTDELRLLGNGVVPATAALAFSTLENQIWAK